jgi:hypothetical protein
VSPEPTDRAAWLEVLDLLEDAVEQAGRPDGSGGSETEPAPWTPPTGIGPLPEDLADRARTLLAAQESAMAELRAAQRTNRSHAGVLRALPHRAGTSSVYLDVEG